MKLKVGQGLLPWRNHGIPKDGANHLLCYPKTLLNCSWKHWKETNAISTMTAGISVFILSSQRMGSSGFFPERFLEPDDSEQLK